MPDNGEIGAFLGGLVVGAVGGVLVKKLIDRLDEDDRPVIVVSGGSLVLKHDKKWKHANSGVPNPAHWTTDHEKGRKVTLYVVQIEVVTSGKEYPLYAAETLRVFFQVPQNNPPEYVRFSRSYNDSLQKHIPRVECSSYLNKTSDSKKLILQKDGYIRGVELDGKHQIQFTKDDEPTITLRML